MRRPLACSIKSFLQLAFEGSASGVLQVEVVDSSYEDARPTEDKHEGNASIVGNSVSMVLKSDRPTKRRLKIPQGTQHAALSSPRPKAPAGAVEAS
ncbi:hypothetical protein ON010_g11797 [Phytophthora cinnamomi]|nr:hypothetical protein ON010_g11797 [Phytophthora cinnamomi]